MTAILKALSAASKVRPLGLGDAKAQEKMQASPIEMELEKALARLDQVGRQVAELESACIEARANGYEEGYRAGHAAGAEDCAEAIELLQAGIIAAHRELHDNLRSTERLAALMAQTCLQSIIGDESHYPDLVRRALEHQLSRLEAASVLEVAVSRQDFDDPAALAQIVETLGAELSIEPKLGRGECRIRVSLGSLEVGPVTQWRRLSETLSEQVGR